MSDATPLPVFIVVRDLLLSSRITTAAKSVNVPFQVVRNPATLSALPGRGVILDLNQPDTLPAALAWRAATGKPVIGFASHVDTDTIQQARAAGIDQVLPRSRFVEILPQLLTDAFPAP